jgi:hypothetical protein
LCGLLVRAPHRLPDYALRAAPVYRAEVTLAVFATGYLIAICVRLAWHGRTFTRLGSTIEVPDVNRRLEKGVASLATAINQFLALHDAEAEHIASPRRSHLSAVDDPDDVT